MPFLVFEHLLREVDRAALIVEGQPVGAVLYPGGKLATRLHNHGELRELRVRHDGVDDEPDLRFLIEPLIDEVAFPVEHLAVDELRWEASAVCDALHELVHISITEQDLLVVLVPLH